VEEDGSPFLYAAIRDVEPFSLSPIVAVPVDEGEEASKAEGNTIESPHYLLSIDPSTGGIARCLHRASGFDAARVIGKRRLFEAVRWDGTEHTLEDVDIRFLAEGPLLARIRVSGRAGDARLQLEFTVYSRWDRVDLDLRVHVPVRSEENRLCLYLPLPGEGAELRIETSGAVERPYREPRGDLLEGADPRRFAIQGFVDASLPAGPGVTVASLDAFAFRMDLGDPAFEALGNDHNYKEGTKDQAGATDFRFRWALRVHAGAYSRSEAFRWSREVANPLLASRGGLRGGIAPMAGLAVDPRRAVATCLKPASYAAQGLVLRIWETAGAVDPCPVEVGSARRAFRTDLLERDLEELPVREGRVLLPVRPFGFAGLRVEP
jgi:hypothetical protein